ncbi:MAG: dihydrofolate reductase [Candidatus Latescibacteria bacterium]|nr:dihydrofolate reductase [Candidatus Latescibacterota bacterium]
MNYVYIAASIDGYIATKDGGIDWLHEQPNPSNSDYGYAEFMKNIDALVMGRNSFEKVLTFGQWPYEKKVFVLSSVLTEVPDELIGKVELLSGPLNDILSAVRSRGFDNLYIDGGVVIQRFLAEDLIDELIVTRIPILLGSGIPLFGSLDTPLRFVHKHTEIYDNALVKSHFVRSK